MRVFLYMACCFWMLTACTKENENANLYPIFFPTDMLFEDFPLDRFSQQVPASPLKTGPATFNIHHTGTEWTGFAVSNRTFRSFIQNASALDSTKFSVYTGTGPNATGNFLVAHAKNQEAFVTFDRALEVEKILIAPTTYLYQAIMYGEGATVSGKPEKTFATGATMFTAAKKSYARVIIKGYNGTAHTGDVIYYLADRNSEEGLKTFTRTDWMPVDLSSLGKVTKLIFDFESSDVTAGVMNTPAYFCIDGIRFKENIYNK